MGPQSCATTRCIAGRSSDEPPRQLLGHGELRAGDGLIHLRTLLFQLVVRTRIAKPPSGWASCTGGSHPGAALDSVQLLVSTHSPNPAPPDPGRLDWRASWLPQDNLALTAFRDGTTVCPHQGSSGDPFAQV